MSQTAVHDQIAKDIAENDVLLYMKGTPVFPQCGFSAAVVHDALRAWRQVQGSGRVEGPGNPPDASRNSPTGRPSRSSM